MCALLCFLNLCRYQYRCELIRIILNNLQPDQNRFAKPVLRSNVPTFHFTLSYTWHYQNGRPRHVTRITIILFNTQINATTVYKVILHVSLLYFFTSSEFQLLNDSTYVSSVAMLQRQKIHELKHHTTC